MVPILRAGLGMMDGVLEHMPSARVSVVGIYRDEETLKPVPYFEKIVSNIEERLALVVDPMLATGSSLLKVWRLLQQSGKPRSLHIAAAIAAPEGLALLQRELGTDAHFWLGAVDERLNDQA